MGEIWIIKKVHTNLIEEFAEYAKPFTTNSQLTETLNPRHKFLRSPLVTLFYTKKTTLTLKNVYVGLKESHNTCLYE
jgi:hypothetical protein